ncbi:hypothetical protein HK096_005201 [Nowakowskiella sp. JEL0078]|nr:hypothetical protein HK096_005201 [Nowakowskiella sp. JEL0078]
MQSEYRIFPLEIVNYIIEFLPAKTFYIIATHFRQRLLQSQPLPNIPELSIVKACTHNLIPLLELWRISPHGFKPDVQARLYATEYASANGHYVVLAYLLAHTHPFTYDYMAINKASANGHVLVLEWWKQSGLQLRYTNRAIDRACWFAHVDVLEWWKQSGLELKYSIDAMDNASEFGHVLVLDWWLKSGLELRWSEAALKTLDWNVSWDVVQWWLNSGLEYESDEWAELMKFARSREKIKDI